MTDEPILATGRVDGRLIPLVGADVATYYLAHHFQTVIQFKPADISC